MQINLSKVKPPFPTKRRRGDTCQHGIHYDPETLTPLGDRCGRPATQIIFWKDKRYSPACSDHGAKALDADAIALVLCIHPIR